MSSSLNIPKQRPQDGTSQQQRMPEALRPDYISVDERSREDLLDFARALATEVRYYNAENLEEGNWETFFTDEIPESAPHKALFIAFLELFNYAQQYLNTLTQRHLDFYYKEVLRLQEKPATPDQVHVLFELARNVENHLIKAGTLLKAGKDNDGKPLYYTTEKDLVINKADIEDLKTLSITKNNGQTQNIQAAPLADSADGLGTPFEEENPQWEIFGDPTKGEQAVIGLAIASPLLFLKEGERTVDVLFTFTDTLPTKVKTLNMADTFDVQLSGEESWLNAEVSAYIGSLTTKQIGVTLSFNAAQPAITAYDKEILGGRFTTIWPLMKIVLKEHTDYDVLNALEPTTVTLTANVTGVKNLVLQNDQGALDPARPFMPFGPQPVIGSSLYIGSGEVFQKRLEDLTLHIDWLDAPLNKFDDHYSEYGTVVENGSDFQADISLLYQKSWLTDPSFQNYQLFVNPGLLSNISTLLQNEGYAHNSNPKDITKYDQHTQTGFIRMELTGPTTPLTAFGHAEYPALYTKQVIDLANEVSGTALPNAPYTPTIKSLSLDYTSTQEITLSGNNNGIDQFFHISPFGNNEYTTVDPPSLLPQYTDEGTLYIGIRNLDPPQQLSILFRPAEGSAAPDVDLRDEDIRWSYLAGDQWTLLEAQQIISNTTKAFQDTGIITFNIPYDASLQHNLMPEGVHWIKAAVATGATTAGKFIALDTQAITAVFTDKENDPSRLNQAMEANIISGLAQKQAAVKSIAQPYPSFNGKAAEQSEAFYTRISELLRHKSRAINSWDYERLILEKFPSIYKVKCFNHTQMDVNNIVNSSSAKAGYVTLITLPGASHKNNANPLEPKTNAKTRTAIREYIKKYTSPFAEVEVRNPRYEQIQLSFNVRFAEGVDQGYHQQLLEEELIRFLSPWAYEDIEDIVFGNEIYSSTVLDFIEKRSYVDVVTNFVMYHIFEDILPDQHDPHYFEGEQNVYHILHHYPAVPNQEVTLDFIVGFDETVVQENYADIPVFLPVFLANIDSFFAAPPEGKPLGEVQRAEVMKYIQEAHNEVAFIRELRFYHIEGTSLKEDTERAVAARPGAILTSAQTHEITLGDGNTCQGVEDIGIGYMIVQGDFMVT